jgi:hypothetical protein
VYEDGKRRLGLARSVVSDSNPLTARVLVNWAWQNHFGTGLVRTPDDFGTRGQAPTHPELLDYLADQFRKNGWSMKWLHRQIMLSQAYRQGAIENEHSRQVDPENQLLWRMPRRRLDFESMRDSMLAACDELDLTMGGRPIDLNASPANPAPQRVWVRESRHHCESDEYVRFGKSERVYGKATGDDGASADIVRSEFGLHPGPGIAAGDRIDKADLNAASDEDRIVRHGSQNSVPNPD